MLVVFAQFEREMIAERTRTALRALHETGAEVPSTRRRSGHVHRKLWAKGLPLHAIAKQLMDDGVRPPRGGARLYESTIIRLLED